MSSSGSVFHARGCRRNILALCYVRRSEIADKIGREAMPISALAILTIEDAGDDRVG